MGTSFNDIFNQFLTMVDDTRFIDGLTTDLLAKTLSSYLDEARGIFGDYCYKNLNDYTPTIRESYTFIVENDLNNFTLSPPPPTNCEFYVAIDSVETEDYSFDSQTNILTLSSTPTLYSELYVGAFSIGSFNETLNIQEITILANAMCIPYLKFYLQKRLHLNQMVYSKEYMIHSQAAQIKELRETLTSRMNEVEQKIVYYTYRQASDSLGGISGINYNNNS